MTTAMDMTGQDRVLILLPHPDDETLATGGLIQHVLEAGATLRIVIATDGDNNPWPQRWIEKRWRIDAAARARWGARRRVEVQSALSTLGASDADVHHLGWPDQGLTELLMRDARAEERLASLVDGFSPSLIVAPAIRDRHPDHNALGMMLALVRARRAAWDCRHFSYVVHGNPGGCDSIQVPVTSLQQDTKLRALQAHASQLSLSRRRMTRLAQRTEVFKPVIDCADSPKPWRHAWVLPRAFPLRNRRALQLLVLLRVRDAVVRARVTIDAHDGETKIALGPGRQPAIQASLRRNGRHLELSLPGASEADACYAKIERTGDRLVIYDHEGWVEIGGSR